MVQVIMIDRDIILHCENSFDDATPEPNIWPPAPKPPSGIYRTHSRKILFGKAVDTIIGLFAGAASSLTLTGVAAHISDRLWVHAGHYAGSNGHQPLSCSFWGLGLLLALSIAHPFKRFSTLYSVFVVSALGAALLTITSATSTLK